MSLLRPEAAKLRALALTLTFSTGEAAAVLVPEDAVFWLSCSIICMVIMATPDPTPTPAPARAQRPKREREVYMAKFADILCFFACGEFFVVGRRGCVSKQASFKNRTQLQAKAKVMVIRISSSQ